MRYRISIQVMKQKMNLSHFVCNDENTIQIILYCTLIASMNMFIYKNNIKSYKRAKIKFIKKLLYSIIFEILEHPDKTSKFKNTIKNILIE